MDTASKERFLKAIELKKPDRVPLFDFPFSPVIFKETLGIEPAFTAKEQLAAALVLGLDSVYIPYKAASAFKLEFIRENVYLDEWGTPSKIDSAAWPINAPVEFIIEDESDLKELKAPDPNLSERYEEMIKVVEMNRGRIALGGVVEGPMTRAWYLHGADRIMWNVYDNPKLIKEIFKVANDFWIQSGLNQIKTGIDYMWIGEDLGYSSGPFFSLEVFRELLYPFLEEIVKEFKKARNDIPICFHCCGDFKIFTEDIIKLGFAGIHPFQRTAGWDIAEVKKKYGKQICIIGNIDSSRTLPFGSPEDVENEVKDTIEIAGKDGGLVIASDHSLHDGIPMDNIWAMIDAVFKYGYY
jgi:uroporphyrinogen decarboxylase